MRDLNPAFLTSKPQLSPPQGEVAVLGLGGMGGSILGEKLELGAFPSSRAEAGEGELLYCPGYPYRHGDGRTQGWSTPVKQALNTQSWHCHTAPCGSRPWMSPSRSVGSVQRSQVGGNLVSLLDLFPIPHSGSIHPPQKISSSSTFCPQDEGKGAEVPPDRNGWRGAQ